MTPNAKDRHDKHCAPALLERLRAAGISATEAALRIGVHRNHLANLKRGTRDGGKPVTITYPDQFALECLLDTVETLRQRAAEAVANLSPFESVKARPRR